MWHRRLQLFNYSCVSYFVSSFFLFFLGIKQVYCIFFQDIVLASIAVSVFVLSSCHLWRLCLTVGMCIVGSSCLIVFVCPTS